MKIESSYTVPMLTPRQSYPFGQMKVGDSILVPGQGGTTGAGAAYAYGRRHKKKFTCRSEKGGVRIWRVK